jgi:hypothetical protein
MPRPQEDLLSKVRRESDCALLNVPGRGSEEAALCMDISAALSARLDVLSSRH